MILKRIVILLIMEFAFKFPFKSLGMVRLTTSMLAAIWLRQYRAIFGSDIVCLKVGVRCLILAVQSVS